jgi:hypothetical protein
MFSLVLRGTLKPFLTAYHGSTGSNSRIARHRREHESRSNTGPGTLKQLVLGRGCSEAIRRVHRDGSAASRSRSGFNCKCAGLPPSRAAELSAEVTRGYDHAMMMSAVPATPPVAAETSKPAPPHSPEPPVSVPMNPPTRPTQGLI